ncbi:uncharacterized protein YlxP (DUF503 family) [Ancylobacter sp. 3268]|uniref:hypothetical protein n=1 Tax=Ancylobacter sp. 3268 TaxID=2817752 RepID=UPI00285A849A|nr:hypothetical protein [Ancylobacter sp. 3268]MDR6955786.1 uncharacterized protein YlxP (DUF503 family) [Ancylobacter sp. 3268]
MNHEMLRAMALIAFLSGNQAVALLRSKDVIARQDAIDLYDRVLLAIDALQEQSDTTNGVLDRARTLVEAMIDQC